MIIGNGEGLSGSSWLYLLLPSRLQIYITSSLETWKRKKTLTGFPCNFEGRQVLPHPGNSSKFSIGQRRHGMNISKVALLKLIGVQAVLGVPAVLSLGNGSLIALLKLSLCYNIQFSGSIQGQCNDYLGHIWLIIRSWGGDAVTVTCVCTLWQKEC